ncbi:MAG: NAD(P)-dependent alcohol dehydrogenase [Polyangiaceae bacterium]
MERDALILSARAGFESEPTMRAVLCTAYGGPEVLKLAVVPRPSPGPDQVRVRVRATTVTAACGMMRRADSMLARLILGLRRPRERYRIMGLEFAGEIDEVGAAVTAYRPGDRVFGFAGFSAGAYAEYLCMSARGSLALMPSRLTFEEAAALVDGPTTALYFLRDRARIRAGDSVLVIGASGAIGTAAVQLARHFGATVTGVTSGRNRELVTSLGASRVVDYTDDSDRPTPNSYDIVFDTVGKSSFRACKPLLRQGGRYLVTTGSPALYLRDAWSRIFGDKKLMYGMSVEKSEKLATIRALVERGELAPVVDRVYPLDSIVEAHRYVDTGHKRGNVVLRVAPR